ncbi:hypothetical protein EDC04DRAFT_2661284 [Pisolithus marmoratus]|nr:hypothetical protein EDC04DRAFT_2661284 [Pisolithus marmoratus]
MNIWCRLKKKKKYNQPLPSVLFPVRSSARNEFLLVHIRHPSGREAIGRIERLPNLHNSTSNPTNNNDHDTISLSYDGTLECLTRHLNYAELYTLSYSKLSEAPSVAHLAALLVTIGTHGGPTSSSGSTSKHASAWFAYSVVEVLREIFKCQYGGMKVGKYTNAWRDFSRKMGSTSQPDPKNVMTHPRRAKADQKEEMDAFTDMLRTMGS